MNGNGASRSQPWITELRNHDIRSDLTMWITACYYYGLDTNQTMTVLRVEWPRPDSNVRSRTPNSTRVDEVRGWYTNHPLPRNVISDAWLRFGCTNVHARNTAFKNFIDEMFGMTINRVWYQFYEDSSSSGGNSANGRGGAANVSIPFNSVLQGTSLTDRQGTNGYH